MKSGDLVGQLRTSGGSVNTISDLPLRCTDLDKRNSESEIPSQGGDLTNDCPDQQCKSRNGSEAASDKRKRRHRVCKSWNGYGTLVEEDEEHSFSRELPATMKPPSRWSLKSRQTPPGGSSSGSDGDVNSPSRVPLIQEEEDQRGPWSVMTHQDAPSTSRLQNKSSLSTPSMLTLLRDEASTSERHGSCGNLPSKVLEAIKPMNRLRLASSTSIVCSRCSSLLSMASSSKYSLNAVGGFVVVKPPVVLCKLCLGEVQVRDTCTIQQCGCVFCKECMRCYVEFEIQEGAYDISCPDAQCARQGVVSLSEVQQLVVDQFMDKYRRFRLNREVDMDVSRLWCPKAGCETVCNICPTGERCLPQSVRCPTCSCDFCSNCKHPWHGGITCEENTRLSNLLTKEPGIPFDNDLIKCCPMCNVPIEKDEGCAQMMCKRCKHVFCWYCLASLDDDFLLRHYDKGPCKNKLGHSRASVIWHRTQVIGIFAGFGILLLVASPLLLLAAPCIVCCKCRVCSGGGKMEADDDA